MSTDVVAGGVPSGVRVGPLRAGERITLTDPKGRRHSVLLVEGGTFHTTKGGVSHDALIGGPEGVVVSSVGGTAFLAMRPLLDEFTVTMPRGAAVVYPKDAAQILMTCDVFPGARVVEAGAGSGALTCSLLRAVGPTGRVRSYERREDFAANARKNVESFFGQLPSTWELTVGDLVESLESERPLSLSRRCPEPVKGGPQGVGVPDPGDAEIDRAILDMLAPWECVDALAERLVPGGVLVAYVATTTQLARTVETLRVHGGFTEPQATETLVRHWHAEGLAVRPRHDMVGHTGFLVSARRMAPGFRAPARKRRPAPGAYGEDYTGPRAEVPVADATRG